MGQPLGMSGMGVGGIITLGVRERMSGVVFWMLVLTFSPSCFVRHFGLQGNDFRCVAGAAGRGALRMCFVLCALIEARRPRLRSWVGGFVESLSALFG